MTLSNSRPLLISLLILVAIMNDHLFGLEGMAAAADTLSSGQCLNNTNPNITASNGQFYLALQSDGNLVLNSLSTYIWASQSSGGVQACMLSTGNLVVYNSSQGIIWQSNTSGNAGAYAKV
jgi:hypothetical protein